MCLCMFIRKHAVSIPKPRDVPDPGMWLSSSIAKLDFNTSAQLAGDELWICVYDPRPEGNRQYKPIWFSQTIEQGNALGLQLL